jgi:hypothetical protein
MGCILAYHDVYCRRPLFNVLQLVVYTDPRMKMPQAPQERREKTRHYVIMMDIGQLSKYPGGYNAPRTNNCEVRNPSMGKSRRKIGKPRDPHAIDQCGCRKLEKSSH